MKLVVATPLYPPEIGGPATYVRELERGLPERGIEVSVVKFSEVRHLPKLVRHYAYYRQVRAALKSADAVLALDPVSVGYPAYHAARSLKKPLLVKIVGDYAWEQGVQRFGVRQTLDDFVRTPQIHTRVRMLQKIQTRVAQHALRVIVPSHYLKKIVSAWAIPPERCMVIYNGIELPSAIPTFERKEEEFLIVSAGRRVPWKGFEAIEWVAKNHGGWRVHIASGVSREEALGWVRTADVFVLNSAYEGFPHALIEAMMLGTPIVATDIEAHREILVHGETGLLVPLNDGVALERALGEIERDPAGARARARAAQERAEDFSLARMLDATAAVLTHTS